MFLTCGMIKKYLEMSTSQWLRGASARGREKETDVSLCLQVLQQLLAL